VPHWASDRTLDVVRENRRGIRHFINLAIAAFHKIGKAAANFHGKNARIPTETLSEYSSFFREIRGCFCF
jgi:hypothetical protein